jgi:hypothetical protein
VRKGRANSAERQSGGTDQIEDEIANACFDEASLKVRIEHQRDRDKTICLRVARRDEHDVTLCGLISQRHRRQELRRVRGEVDIGEEV